MRDQLTNAIIHMALMQLEFPPLAGHGCYAARVSVV